LIGSSGGVRDGGWAKWGLRSLSPKLVLGGGRRR
jgi:hypothetical protein